MLRADCCLHRVGRQEGLRPNPHEILRDQQPAILVWAPARVLAVSALHEYAGLPHHEHLGKHIRMLSVVGVAIILGLAVWIILRRHGSGVAPAKPQAWGASAAASLIQSGPRRSAYSHLPNRFEELAKALPSESSASAAPLRDVA